MSIEKAIPIEIKFDENVLDNAKALGRLQGMVYAFLIYKVCKAIIKHEEKKLAETKEES